MGAGAGEGKRQREREIRGLGHARVGNGERKRTKREDRHNEYMLCLFLGLDFQSLCVDRQMRFAYGMMCTCRVVGRKGRSFRRAVG